MTNPILLAIIQAATEFLPISSSGHLALFSQQPNLFLITILHIASLLAVLIFTRKEIIEILTLKQPKLAIYLIIATIPAVIFGLVYKPFIETALNSNLAIGTAFIFTGFILLLTKIKTPRSRLNKKNAIIIGLFQMLALFPGISRSGMTISSAKLAGIEPEKAAKFSFLLFIPLAIGAIVLESGQAYFNTTLAIAFIICFLLSLVFLNLLTYIIKKNYFWMFAFYCFAIGIISLIIYFI